MDSPCRREQVFCPCEVVAACEALQSWFFTTSSRRVKNEILAVRRDAGRTLGTKGLDLMEPSANFSPKEAVGRILFGTELIRQTAGAEERNANGWTVQCPRLPDEPNAQIEHPRGVGEKRHDLSLDGNAVVVDLLGEGITEHDEVKSGWNRNGSRFVMMKPEFQAIEEMKARPI